MDEKDFEFCNGCGTVRSKLIAEGNPPCRVCENELFYDFEYKENKEE